MKKIIHFSFRTLLIAVVLFSGAAIKAQGTKGLPAGSGFKYYIANETRNGNNLEFDLFLLNTDASNPFELGNVQAGILINPSIINGGNIHATILQGTSALNASQAPAVISFVQRKNCIRLASKSSPGIGGGTIISTDVSNPTKVCRIRLTNSKSWANGDAGLRFNFTSKPYPTKISKYVYETGMNTPLEVNAGNCFTQEPGMQSENEKEFGLQLAQERVTVFPNPNQGNFTITVTTDRPTIFELVITNSVGAVVLSIEKFEVDGKRSEELQMRNAADGSYTLVLNDGKEQLSRKFIIKK